MMNERLAATYVAYEGQEFLVSTIDRLCSAANSHGMIAETVVWAVDAERQRTGLALMHETDAAGSVRVHCEMVKRIREIGPGGGTEQD